MIQVGIKNISNNKLPRYEHKGDAGLDIRADFSRTTPENPIKAFGNCQLVFATEKMPIPYIVLDPGARAKIPTGIMLDVPYGYEVQIRPRSGLTLKEGVMAALGTGDASYKNEYFVTLFNLGLEPVVIEHSERIAQLVFKKVEEIEWVEVDDVGESERGTNGHGSTGKF